MLLSGLGLNDLKAIAEASTQVHPTSAKVYSSERLVVFSCLTAHTKAALNWNVNQCFIFKCGTLSWNVFLLTEWHFDIA